MHDSCTGLAPGHVRMSAAISACFFPRVRSLTNPVALTFYRDTRPSRDSCMLFACTASDTSGPQLESCGLNAHTLLRGVCSSYLPDARRMACTPGARHMVHFSAIHGRLSTTRPLQDFQCA